MGEKSKQKSMTRQDVKRLGSQAAGDRKRETYAMLRKQYPGISDYELYQKYRELEKWAKSVSGEDD